MNMHYHITLTYLLPLVRISGNRISHIQMHLHTHTHRHTHTHAHTHTHTHTPHTRTRTCWYTCTCNYVLFFGAMISDLTDIHLQYSSPVCMPSVPLYPGLSFPHAGTSPPSPPANLTKSIKLNHDQRDQSPICGNQ